MYYIIVLPDYFFFYQGFNVSEALPQEEIDKLKDVFNKLDADSTGWGKLYIATKQTAFIC